MSYTYILFLVCVMAHHNYIYIVIPCIVNKLSAHLMELILYPSVPLFSKSIHLSCPVPVVTCHGTGRESFHLFVVKLVD